MNTAEAIYPERLHAMHQQCWVRRGVYGEGGCPCLFEHQCRVPTEELRERLEAEHKRARAKRVKQ